MSNYFDYNEDQELVMKPHILKNQKMEKQCCICGKKYTASSHNSSTCSDSCSNRRYVQRLAHPSKSNGTFTNNTAFDKAWEEAKKQWEWKDNNINVQNWTKTL
jgi:hypothetical protein